MKMFVCAKCGHIEFGEAPANCPVCYAPKDQFTEDAAALKSPADPAALTDGDKKHIPVWVVNKSCGLIPDGCWDAHVKVGEIEHVMETEHWIMWIDVYFDHKYISRFFMTPGSLHPAVGLHLKPASGTLTAIESCNKHGKWMAEIKI